MIKKKQLYSLAMRLNHHLNKLTLQPLNNYQIVVINTPHPESEILVNNSQNTVAKSQDLQCDPKLDHWLTMIRDSAKPKTGLASQMAHIKSSHIHPFWEYTSGIRYCEN